MSAAVHQPSPAVSAGVYAGTQQRSTISTQGSSTTVPSTSSSGAPAPSEREQPLYSWIITINREPTDAEFATCLRCLDDESYSKITAIPNRDDAWRSLLGRLIPSIIMKQRNVPRSNWSIKYTNAGKPYIDAPKEEKHLGYNIAHNGSLDPRSTRHDTSRLAQGQPHWTSYPGDRSRQTSSSITQPRPLHDTARADPQATINPTSDTCRTSVMTETRMRFTLDGSVVDLENPELLSRAGSFGDVYVGRHPVLGALALKRPRGLDQKYTRSFLAEAGIWQRLRHRNVLPFIAAVDSSPDFWLVSPFMENGNLPNYLKLNPKVNRVPLAFQLASAIAYLHQEGVVHGDIKGNNILIAADGEVRLCDFGLSKSVRDGMVTDSALKGAGSLRWQAPELLGFRQPTGTGGDPEALDVHKTYASDTYAFGLTIYEILSDKAPFGHQSFYHILEAVKNDERPPKEPAMSATGESYDSLWAIAEKCWQRRPSDRPSMDAVCKYWDVPVEPELNSEHTGSPLPNCTRSEVPFVNVIKGVWGCVCSTFSKVKSLFHSIYST